MAFALSALALRSSSARFTELSTDVTRVRVIYAAQYCCSSTDDKMKLNN